jgi:hypothetical protein
MKNRAAIFAAIASSTVLALSIFACTSDGGSQFTNPNTDAGATFQEGGGFNVDSRAPDDTGTGTVVCNPALPVDFGPKFLVPTATDDCTSQQVDDYYTTCLISDTGTLLLKDPKCTTWLAANKQCGDCIEQDETDTTSGPIQLFRDRLYFLLNTGGCISLEQGKSDSTSCGYNYDISAQCRRESCDNCFDKSPQDLTPFKACETTSQQSGKCKDLNATAATACTGYKDNDASVNQCFPIPDSSEASKSFYGRVMRIFCAK